MTLELVFLDQRMRLSRIEPRIKLLQQTTSNRVPSSAALPRGASRSTGACTRSTSTGARRSSNGSRSPCPQTHRTVRETQTPQKSFTAGLAQSSCSATNPPRNGRWRRRSNSCASRVGNASSPGQTNCSSQKTPASTPTSTVGKPRCARRFRARRLARPECRRRPGATAPVTHHARPGFWPDWQRLPTQTRLGSQDA